MKFCLKNGSRCTQSIGAAVRVAVSNVCSRFRLKLKSQSVCDHIHDAFTLLQQKAAQQPVLTARQGRKCFTMNNVHPVARPREETGLGRGLGAGLHAATRAQRKRRGDNLFGSAAPAGRRTGITFNLSINFTRAERQQFVEAAQNEQRDPPHTPTRHLPPPPTPAPDGAARNLPLRLHRPRTFNPHNKL